MAEIENEPVAIEVPRPVYLELQRYAKFGESPVQALARLLEEAAERKHTQVTVTRSVDVGSLFPLLERGLVTEGDEVEYRRPRRGERHSLTVSHDGFLKLADGRVCASPSGVITEISGTTDNGWKLLRHLPSGRTLGELREEAQKDAPVALRSSRTTKPYSSISALIEADAIAVGDDLVGRFRHQDYHAVVGVDGTVVFGGVEYASPSKAWASAIGKGTSDSVAHAWEKWRHVPSNMSLYNIREKLCAEKEDKDEG